MNQTTVKPIPDGIHTITPHIYGQIPDPFGYRWGLAQHVREVPPEEVVRIAATLFGNQGGPR